MFEFFTQLLATFQQASRRQLFALFTFLAILVLVAGLWERWTAGFRLTKLERATAILEHVSQIPGTDTDAVQRLADHVTGQVAAILAIPGPSAVSHTYLTRVGVSFLVWFGLSLFMLPSVLRKSKSKGATLLGVLILNLLPALLSGLFPEGNWPWRHVVLYPLVVLVITFFIGLVAAIAIPSFVKARDMAQHNTCMNNLRLLDAAKEQAALQHGFHEGMEVTAEHVASSLVNGFSGLVCPKGGRYDIMPIGQPPQCSVHGDLFGGRAANERGDQEGKPPFGVSSG